MMNIKIIACEVLRDELLAVSPRGISIKFMSFHLHNYPDLLRSELQSEINRSTEYNCIILCYGNCGRGIIGLQVPDCTLVVPRVNDCIHLMFGCSADYHRERKKEPGTFYLTKGWIERGSDAVKDYEKMCARYGDRKAKLVTRETYKHYKRVALIDNGSYTASDYLAYAEALASFINADSLEILPGSLTMFYKMVHGDWDDSFRILERFTTVMPDDYISNVGTHRRC